MEMVKFKDKIIAFNIGAVFLCKKYPKEMLEVLKYVDIVFGNDHVSYHSLADRNSFLNCFHGFRKLKPCLK